MSRQLIASLLAAVIIVGIAVAVVTASFGTTSQAELEGREERLEQRMELREERSKLREDRRKDARD